MFVHDSKGRRTINLWKLLFFNVILAVFVAWIYVKFGAPHSGFRRQNQIEKKIN